MWAIFDYDKYNFTQNTKTQTSRALLIFDILMELCPQRDISMQKVSIACVSFFSSNMQVSNKKSLKSRLAIGNYPILKVTGGSEHKPDRIGLRKCTILPNLDCLTDSLSDRIPVKREHNELFFQKRHVYKHFSQELEMLYERTPPSFSYFYQILI